MNLLDPSAGRIVSYLDSVLFATSHGGVPFGSAFGAYDRDLEEQGETPVYRFIRAKNSVT
jgi:hypothetical protein